MKNLIIKLSGSIICIFLIFTMIFNSCKEDEDDTPDEPEVVIPETTKIISNEDWQSNIIEIDSADWTITFDGAITQKYDLETGDIIISGKGEGLLRKITELKDQDNKLIVKTTQAALAEAVEKGRFEFSEDLEFPEKSPKIEYFVDGVTIKETKGRDGEETQFKVTINVPVHENVDVTGELEIDPSISGKAKIEKYDLKYLEINFDIKEQLDLTTTVTIASLELEKEITLAKITFPTITVMMGVVPVTLTPVFTVKIGVTIGTSSTVTTGVTQDLEIKTGVIYDDGDWSTSYDLDKGFDNIPPALNNTAEAKAYIKPQLDIKIYGIISPNISTQLYGLLEAELGADPWWSLYAGLSADIGVKVKVFIITLADFNANIFDLQYLIAEAHTNTNPEACFTVDPSSGNLGEKFYFDASCCTDEEDPLEDLRVRWDWDDDGSWDTDFMYKKEIDQSFEEPGAHTIRLEVIDTDDASDETTRQVTVNANYSPEAAFTVNPSMGTTDTVFRFNGGISTDEEDPVEDLQVRWDWDGDGNFDTDFSYNKEVNYQFPDENNYNVTMEVIDTEGATGQATVLVIVSDEASGIPCPGYETVEYGGQVYNTVLIGGYCWFKENLNIGSMLIHGEEEQADNGIIEKYCYDNDESNCELYGGLYLWDELMQYINTEAAQGICPPGWHIPTDNEWKILSGMVDSQYGIGDPEWDGLGGTGYDAGKKLKTTTGWDYNTGTDDFGFSALPGGYSKSAGFTSRGTHGKWYTSSEKDSEITYQRYLYYMGDNIGRNTSGKHYGYSVRCLKD